MIQDFIQNVFWSDRDFLIIDTPPGTSDEHISVIQNLRSYNPDGAVVITTPQVGYSYFQFFSLQGIIVLHIRELHGDGDDGITAVMGLIL